MCVLCARVRACMYGASMFLRMRISVSIVWIAGINKNYISNIRSDLSCNLFFSLHNEGWCNPENVVSEPKTV